MVRETYTKPEFGFQEMELFERVAATCWGTAQLWLDTNGDDAITEGLDIKIDTGGGCKGNESASILNGEIAVLNAALNAFNSSDKDYTILSQYKPALGTWAEENGVESISPITATANANWANTQASSGGGVIIIGS